MAAAAAKQNDTTKIPSILLSDIISISVYSGSVTEHQVQPNRYSIKKIKRQQRLTSSRSAIVINWGKSSCLVCTGALT